MQYLLLRSGNFQMAQQNPQAHHEHTELGSVESRFHPALSREQYGLAFSHPSTLAAHKSSIRHIKNTPHLGSVEYRIKPGPKCEPCGRAFPTPKALTMHLKTNEHIKNTQSIDATGFWVEPPRKCEHCGKTFARPYSLVKETGKETTGRFL